MFNYLVNFRKEMGTNETPVASMYVSEDCALIGFSFVNKGICLERDFFEKKIA